MYTILMNDDKSLTCTVKATIYQKEKNVDKIRFLFPTTYEDINLAECTAVMKYRDQGNVWRAEVIKKQEELYLGKLQFLYNVSTNFTRFAGDIQIYVSFLRLDVETGLKEEVLHTGKTTITILPIDDVMNYDADSLLSQFDQMMLEVQAQQQANKLMMESIDSNKADDIKLDEESQEVYLTANGQKIGNSISLNELGNVLADATDAGLIQVITEGEVVDDDNTESSVTYSLFVNQETDELCLIVNGQIVCTVPTKDIGESIVDVTSEGLTEVITE